ncbi:hypothetical protein [Mycobacteroides abscessus]|uniref:hypothetical protein n=1 Tax=Mycobacteroides abscessus TaxID=36809 RepID=UPI000C26039D|nr:hypothetical protein [Mycobacteroides abscessus]
MGAYFEAVVMLDDGPFPVWAHGFDTGGHDLAGVSGWGDIRTRAIYAYLLEQPRRVWWAADESKLGEHLDTVWVDRFGTLPSRRVELRDNIPDSIQEYVILINHDMGEYLDASNMSFCPLPVLCASYGADTLAGHPLAGRWHGDTISVTRRGTADLDGLRQITETEPRPAGPGIDPGLLAENPDLASAYAAVSQDRRWDYVQSYDEHLNPILTVIRSLEPAPNGREHPSIDGQSYLAYIRYWHSHTGDCSLQWATVGQARYTRPVPAAWAGPAATSRPLMAMTKNYPWGTVDGTVHSNDIGAAAIEGAWAYIWDSLPRR